MKAFLKSVSVEPVRNTRLVEIRVEDTDPKLAAEIANAIASVYVHQNLELKLGAARDALTWLTTQVSDLKTKVNDSELTLQRYREQVGLVSAEEKQSLAAKKLAEFNGAYIDAKAKRLEMETRLGESGGSSEPPEVLESSPIVLNNPLIQRLKGQLVELEVTALEAAQDLQGQASRGPEGPIADRRDPPEDPGGDGRIARAWRASTTCSRRARPR